ncbi:MAG: NAD(P)H-hydrate epimerase [Actinomycetota bacterium]|nr:NAD(P)H-hydrate epimerase [Actinomycetota bacterium]
MTAHTYLTPNDVEVPAVTTDQMREIDRVAIEEVGPNLYQMMENAGRNLALTAIETMGPDWDRAPVVVLAGTGGNGGGGICAARHLANRGADVTVVISDPANLGTVPAHQLSVYEATRGKVAAVSTLETVTAALVVDSIIGYSLRGAAAGAAAEMIEWAGGQPVPVVSLDVPSGIDSTTGQAEGAHVAAARTLTLALPKTGLDVAATGDLWLGDIGIPQEVYRRVGFVVPGTVFGSAYRVQIRPVQGRRG